MSADRQDTAYNLYHRPFNRFVADFIGLGSLLRGIVIGEYEVYLEHLVMFKQDHTIAVLE